MATNPYAYYTATMMDASEEKSTYKIPMRVYSVVAGQFDADLVRLTTLKGTIATICGGVLTNDAVSPIVTRFDATPPTDSQVQRERKWLVTYQDLGTFRRYQTELPCAMPKTGAGASRMITGTDKADLTHADIAAFVTAFEVFVDSPDGNGINVLEIEMVGRNL